MELFNMIDSQRLSKVAFRTYSVQEECVFRKEIKHYRKLSIPTVEVTRVFEQMPVEDKFIWE